MRWAIGGGQAARQRAVTGLDALLRQDHAEGDRVELAVLRPLRWHQGGIGSLGRVLLCGLTLH